MVNFIEVMETIWQVEHNGRCDKVLHYNRKEHDYTFYGIYPMKKLLGSYELYELLEGGMGIKSVSKMFCNKSLPIYQEVLYFYYKNFWQPMGLDYIESTHKAKEIMVFHMNVGRRKMIIRELQRLVGVKTDGIIGKHTLKAINDYPEYKFDKEFDNIEIRFYRDLVNRVSSLKWALKGWINRAKRV